MMMYEMISCLKDYAKIRNEYCFKSEMNTVPYFAKIHIVICYWSLLVRDASSTSAPQYHQKIGPVTKDIIFYNKWHIFVLTYDMHFLTRGEHLFLNVIFISPATNVIIFIMQNVLFLNPYFIVIFLYVLMRHLYGYQNCIFVIVYFAIHK